METKPKRGGNNYSCLRTKCIFVKRETAFFSDTSQPPTQHPTHCPTPHTHIHLPTNTHIHIILAATFKTGTS